MDDFKKDPKRVIATLALASLVAVNSETRCTSARGCHKPRNEGGHAKVLAATHNQGATRPSHVGGLQSSSSGCHLSISF